MQNIRMIARIRTDFPFRRPYRAAVIPAGPPPTTIISTIVPSEKRERTAPPHIF